MVENSSSAAGKEMRRVYDSETAQAQSQSLLYNIFSSIRIE